MRLPMFSQTTAWTRIPHRHQELEIETDLQVNLFPERPEAQQSSAKTKARTGSTVLFVIPCRDTTKDGRHHEKKKKLPRRNVIECLVLGRAHGNGEQGSSGL